jgi:hypothetical protein
MRDGADVQQAGAAGASPGEQIRQEVRQALEQARQGAAEARRNADEASQAAVAAQAAGADAQPGTVFRVGPGGEIIQVRPGETVTAPPPGEPTIVVDGMPIQFEPEIPQGAVTMALAFFAMIAFIIVGLPIARAFGRRMDRRGAMPERPSAEQAEQLRQIQTAVEAMAVEVERISENQRFVTRLLAEGAAAEVKLPARPLAESRVGEARDTR